MEKPIALERRFSLDVAPEEEKIFVMTMAAGPHVFVRIVPRGYEEAAALLGIRFSVAPGTTTHIGRRILELPEKLPLSKGQRRGAHCWVRSSAPGQRARWASEQTVLRAHIKVREEGC